MSKNSESFQISLDMADDPDLLDYDENADAAQQQPVGVKGKGAGPIRGTYVSIHASGFKDFLLKPELLRAIMDCGFEHPSEGSLSLLSLPSF